MVIIWGKKVVRRTLGWVGDFCPICRGLECMRVVRMSQVPHLYYIPLGRGQIVAHEISCNRCGSLFAATSIGYESFAPHASSDAVTLAAETAPGSLEAHSERLDLEDRAVAGRLSSEERLRLIAEPIAALEYMAVRRGGKGTIPTGAGLAIIALVFLVPTTVIVWVSPGTPTEARITLAGLVVLLVIGTILGFKFGGRAWVRRNAIPRLAAALHPLRPTVRELDETLRALAADGCFIGTRIQAAELAAAVQARSTQP